MFKYDTMKYRDNNKYMKFLDQFTPLYCRKFLRKKSYKICFIICAIGALALTLLMLQLEPRKKDLSLLQQRPVLTRIAYKIGILDLEDYIGGNFKADEKFRKCQKAIFQDPQIMMIQNRYFFANYSHVAQGREFQGGVEAAIFVHAVKTYQKVNGISMNLDEADIVLVNDFCFLNQFDPDFDVGVKVRKRIQNVYENVLNSARWQLKNGSDFIFVPSYPANSNLFEKSFICENLKNSFFVLYEWANFFYECNFDSEFHKEKTIIVPHFSPLVPKTLPDVSERKFLVSFVGSCSRPEANEQPGNVLRGYMHNIFRNQNYGKDVQFHCMCVKSQGAKNCRNRASNYQVQKLYQYSKFCFIFPGDSYSTSRLTEVILNGCVPVFVGPPFHVLPFESQITYEKLALFYQMDLVAIPVLSGRTFKLHDYIRGQKFVRIKNAAQIIEQLQTINSTKYLQNIQQHRSKFSYITYPEQYPTATDLVFQEICRIHNRSLSQTNSNIQMVGFDVQTEPNVPQIRFDRKQFQNTNAKQENFDDKAGSKIKSTGIQTNFQENFQYKEYSGNQPDQSAIYQKLDDNAGSRIKTGIQTNFQENFQYKEYSGNQPDQSAIYQKLDDNANSTRETAVNFNKETEESSQHKKFQENFQYKEYSGNQPNQSVIQKNLDANSSHELEQKVVQEKLEENASSGNNTKTDFQADSGKETKQNFQQENFINKNTSNDEFEQQVNLYNERNDIAEN